jgi:hypothetical protein
VSNKLFDKNNDVFGRRINWPWVWAALIFTIVYRVAIHYGLIPAWVYK